MLLRSPQNGLQAGETSIGCKRESMSIRNREQPHRHDGLLQSQELRRHTPSEDIVCSNLEDESVDEGVWIEVGPIDPGETTASRQNLQNSGASMEGNSRTARGARRDSGRSKRRT